MRFFNDFQRCSALLGYEISITFNFVPLRNFNDGWFCLVADLSW